MAPDAMRSAYRMLSGASALPLPKHAVGRKDPPVRGRGKKRRDSTSSDSSASPSPARKAVVPSVPHEIDAEAPRRPRIRPARSPPSTRVLHCQNYPICADLPTNNVSVPIPKVKEEPVAAVVVKLEKPVVKEAIVEYIGDDWQKTYYVDSAIQDSSAVPRNFGQHLLYPPPFHVILYPIIEGDQLSHSKMTSYGENRSITKEFVLSRDALAGDVVVIIRFGRYPAAVSPTHPRHPQNLQVSLNGEPVVKVKVFADKLPSKPEIGSPIELPRELIAGGENELLISWTTKDPTEDYSMYVESARRKTVEIVVDELGKQRIGLAHGILRTFKMFNQDDDGIETNSSMINLTCPLSRKRISVPVRGVNCGHLDCFDAANYLDLNKSARAKWTCPRCSDSVALCDLVVDEFIVDVLRSTPDDTAVNIFPGEKSVMIRRIKRRHEIVSLLDATIGSSEPITL